MFSFSTQKHIQLADRLTVGSDIAISFDIKPRARDGLLLVVYGRQAMLAVQLYNGTIVLKVKNAEGKPFSAVFNPEKGQNFCDGQWHSVTAVKSQYVITLIVDKLNSSPTIGATTSISTDTSRPVFVGGHPKFERTKWLDVQKPYIGCMRNFNIREVAYPINVNMAYGNVQVGVCPLN